MRDQATIAFTDHNGYEYTRVYLTHGGNAVMTTLHQFFADERDRNRRQVNWYHLRFQHPMFLAARFVAYALPENGQKVGLVPNTQTGPMHFTVACPQTDNEDPVVTET